jgi:integrase/recombinase XerD
LSGTSPAAANLINSLIGAETIHLFTQLGRFLEKAYIPDAEKPSVIGTYNEAVMNDHISGFIEHMKVKNYSPQTIATYSEHLPGLFAHLKEQGITDIKRVSRDHLQAYQLAIASHTSERTKERYSVGTICTKTRAMKRFFQYLEDSGTILINPAEHIKEPKAQKRLPRTVLSEEEVRKILAQPKLSTDNGIRARAILEVFYSTGIRLEELINLTIFDCDLQGGLIRVKGKFSKDRVVPLGKHAVKFLKEYITQVRPQQTRKNKAVKNLFVSRFSDPLSKQVIELMVRGYARKAGIKKKVTPHTFRHTFATDLIRNGADIIAVRNMLGHSALSSTNIYIHVAGTDVKRTHTQSHPRERDKEAEIVPDIRTIKEQPHHGRL